MALGKWNRRKSTTAAAMGSGEEVEAWCQSRLGGGFLGWFNKNIAGQGPWEGVRVIDTPANRTSLRLFWNQTPTLLGRPVSPIQFLALMAIFANECRADFTPKAERVGRAGYPGLTYPFDRIPNLKRSYNTLPGNKTAFACFHSAPFLSAHGDKALGASLARTTDVRWQGEIYPRGAVATSVDPAVTGFAMEADFMKFRGRGFIQTTGRPNYAKLIEFVQQYTGPQSVLALYAEKWKQQSVDAVADLSSNEDWDRLFDADLIVAAHAVRLHNFGSGDYLRLDGDRDAALRRMGKCISGSDAYAEKYRRRMAFLLAQLPV